ncbi:2,3-bisphosphoglycerate-independent phosphoglycerate mutase [Catenuloplanes japonicus]|uniref:2,3-bisphosphoglycerate-independent phosphoglycerate mutase n=1 Tax=Catenuloplanes japonicus TaxID=33876 RepID=UPI0005246B9B|nr:2,3-bisphosphoglycerate-independent phosphoglycerate mutase [Catenuloplanes japonicus]
MSFHSGVLLVLDGWGAGPAGPDNALTTATTPVLDRLVAGPGSTLLAASGEAVGLLPGTVGNSEIGHMVIGAGRPLPYDSLLVAQQIASGELRRHELLNDMCADLAGTGGALHLVGLCSDGMIHANVEHLSELLAVAAGHGVATVQVHAITDGRDVSDGTARAYLSRVEEIIAGAGAGRIATVVGRGYAMDKAGKTALTTQAGALVADGVGESVSVPQEAISLSARGDEWVPASVVGTSAPIVSGDAVLFFNFRSDRIQQLADDLVGRFADTGREVRVVSLTQYDTRASIPALVPRADASGGLAHELDVAGARSVRIAEPEKFEHVTYYVNGRSSAVSPVEEHVRIGDGNDPAAHPQMHVAEVAQAVVDALQRSEVALVVANLANIDVVGHTGVFDATVRAAEHTDAAVSGILAAAAEAGRWVALVGDHGNAEVMRKPGVNGDPRPYGGHTTNPVPFVLVPAPGHKVPESLPAGGTLADVAPTVLTLLGLKPGAVMTGRSLV